MKNFHIFILTLVSLLLAFSSCNTVIYGGGKLDDSSYSTPQTLPIRGQAPSEVSSPLDKQVNFVSPGQSKKKNSNSNAGNDVTQKKIESVANDGAVGHVQTTVVGSAEVQDDYRDEPEGDPSSAQAVVVAVGKDNQHPSRTSYDPFVGGKLLVDLDEASQNFTYPINGKYSSGYGSRGRGWHSGVDLTAPAGTPIYAVFDGKVRMSKPYGGYGNMIVLQHANGLETVYGHCSQNLVREGEVVKSGDKIALCGRTGRASGTHLHFEVRVAGQTLNPALLLNYSLKTNQTGVLKVVKSGSRIAASRSNDSNSTQEPQTKPNTPPREALLAQAKEATSTNTNVSSSENSAKSNKSSSATGASVHTVVKGDTLYAIAKKNGTTVDKLCALNNINKSVILKLGLKLKVK